MSMFLRRAAWLAALSVPVVGVAFAGGCNIVAPFYLLIHGPEKVQAQYDLPRDRPTVIFIDDRGSHLPRRALRLKIGQDAEKVLLSSGKLKDVISTQSAMGAASQDRAGEPLPIAEIGRAVGAEVVIYATVDQFTLSPDGGAFAPVAQLRVKVLDAAADQRLWPAEPTGYVLSVRPSARQGPLPTGLADQFKAQDELAALVGEALARTFIRHDREARLPKVPQ